MRVTGRLDAYRLRLARDEGLSFPEPFFWTTDYLERLRARDSDYRSRLIVGAIDVVVAPATQVRIISEGDSWFNYPGRKDIVDWLEVLGYAPYRSDAPGRLLTTMVQEKVYLKFLGDSTVRSVLLSGGGNDLISWKRPSKQQPSPIFKRGNGSSNPADYLNDAEVVAALAELRRLLGVVASDVRNVRPKMPIILHCYDWIEPRTDGPCGAWIGPQMDQVGVPANQRLRNAIARLLIDRANEAYQVACEANGMTHVDLRGTVGRRWWDEIHPNHDAWGEIARKLAASIPIVARRRAHAATRRRGDARRHRAPAGRSQAPRKGR